MKTKTKIFISSLCITATALTVAVLGTPQFKLFASEPDYQINITNLSNGTKIVKTTDDNDIDFSISNMSETVNVTNEDTVIKNTTAISGIKKIIISKTTDSNETNKVSFAGGWEDEGVIDYSYFVMPDFEGNIASFYFDPINTGYPDYFKLTFKSVIEITNILIEYSCIPAEVPESLVSELPYVNINSLDGKGVPNKNYVDTMISITNAGKKNNLDEVPAQVKIRGNSTALYDKKPYRIKFDKKQKLFGKTKNKSWVLLADYLDPSALHNYAAFQLTNYFDRTAYSPLAQHVRVYLDGEYKGLYLLTEHPDEKEGRTNVPLAFNENLTEFSYFLELDAIADQDSDLEAYFPIQISGSASQYFFALKSPEKKDFLEYYIEELEMDEETASTQTEITWDAFIDYMNAEVANIKTTFEGQDFNEMNELIDQNSFVDYMLIDQIMGEKDHYNKSFKFYRRMNEKIKFGPIWDYDWVMHTPWTNAPNDNPGINQSYYSNIFMKKYFDTAYGAPVNNKQALADRWYSVGKFAILQLRQMLLYYAEELEMELYKDADLWYAANCDLVDRNVIYLTDYIYNQIATLDAHFNNYR